MIAPLSVKNDVVSSGAPRGVAYDAIADWYSATIHAGSPIHEVVIPALLQLAMPAADERVLDLACGEGIVARSFAQAGARVVGVDISRRLLTAAQEEERRRSLGIDFRVDDARRLDTVADASVDGVVSSLALTDVPDLTATARSVHRVLRPGGWFVFAINHPCGPVSSAAGTLLHAARDYFAESFWYTGNPESVRGKVGAYHRPMSAYLNAFTAAGFELKSCVEPRATATFVSRIPEYEHVPLVLALRWRKEA